MKLKFKKESNLISSFSVDCIHAPYIDMNWHYHSDYEMTYIIKGSGLLLIGDYMSSFKPGELYLIGSNLPHIFVNDESDKSEIDMICVKFPEKPAGIDLFHLYELKDVLKLLEASNKGLSFGKETVRKAHLQFKKLIRDIHVAEKLSVFLKILCILSESEDVDILSSVDFAPTETAEKNERIVKIINYIYNNFDKQMTLEEIAGIASITPNSLCRYFKTRTNKTLFEFIKGVRVDHACQMLINNNLPISQVCYNSGFNSLASFNRIFKSIKGYTPSEYRMQFLNL